MWRYFGQLLSVMLIVMVFAPTAVAMHPLYKDTVVDWVLPVLAGYLFYRAFDQGV